MRFPRSASADADAHTSAQDRLDEARDEQRQVAARRDAADPGSGEAHAETELSVAEQQVAAREAWLKWASSSD